MSKKFAPSAQQLAVYDWVQNGTGSAVLVAVAGAGKTTTLVEAIKLMEGTAFLGAYNSKNGKDLKERIGNLPGKFAGTFHSAGFRALCRANPELKKKDPDDKKVRKIAEFHLSDKNTGESIAVDGEVAAVCQLVSLAKQTGFYVRTLVPHVEPRYWAELVSRHDVADRLPEDYQVSRLCRLADVVLRESNSDRDTIDFDDMVYLPLLLNLRFFPNDWVLIDEAQDTNAVRRELARRMLKPRTGRLLAVGDPHQAIYGFTGADNRSMDMIKEQFGAQTLELSVSWRCPRRVVDVARSYVSHIEPAPTAKEGSVQDMTYESMVEACGPGDAVICRYNAPLVELCFRLIREGKPAKIEGRAIGEGLAALMGRWKVKTLDAFENRLTTWNERERAKFDETAAKPDDAKLAKHEDKYATILTLLSRAREQKMTRVEEMQEMVLGMFADVGASPALVVLSSVHRSKGLEWPRVFVLGRHELMPSPRATQEWQKEQEVNLCYVAVTRAQETLVDVWMPTDKKPVAKKEKTNVEAA